MMAARPTVKTEKLPRGDELMNAFRALEKVMGRKIDAVLCGEAGGVNSCVPFVVAAAAGLPMVDADGMGRALSGTADGHLDDARCLGHADGAVRRQGQQPCA